jgi:hypothetical protein
MGAFLILAGPLTKIRLDHFGTLSRIACFFEFQDFVEKSPIRDQRATSQRPILCTEQLKVHAGFDTQTTMAISNRSLLHRKT